MNAGNLDIDCERFDAFIDWVVDGAPTAQFPPDVVREVGERIVSCGIPVNRIAFFARTLHPSVMGRRFIWRPGHDVEITEAPFSIMESDDFLENPFPRVIQSGEPIRRRIGDADCPDDFRILAELRDEGVTDYLVQPLVFSDGQVQAVSWTTRRPGGFADAHLRALERARRHLARLAEVFALRRTAQNLLDAYLGHQSGERVLRGLIRRGDGEDIHAVIWFSDLRGSTPLAESLPRAAFLTVLNAFFECTAGAVLDHGGEVLRFIGDAALAIFPIAAPEQVTAGQRSNATTEAACATALAAARDAVVRMETLNRDRSGRGEEALGFGIALHLGDVMYGNIGTPQRLEFTVIGAAANEAARLEGMCKVLEKPLLLSAEVVGHLPGDWPSLGRYKLRGIGDEVEIFTTPEAFG